MLGGHVECARIVKLVAIMREKKRGAEEKLARQNKQIDTEEREREKKSERPVSQLEPASCPFVKVTLLAAHQSAASCKLATRSVSAQEDGRGLFGLVARMQAERPTWITWTLILIAAQI